MISDPIVALGTPPGRSALAVVRVSGRGALEVAGHVVQGETVDRLPARVAHLVTFQSSDRTPIDQGLVTVFRAPHSYTGDDLVEFSCHGGLLVPAQLMVALERAGARLAAPGEFTRRAVLNGKMDLLQAEAVGDLIDATAPAQGRAALRQLDGALSRRLQSLREDLLQLLALLAYDIDFPEEDDGPVPRQRFFAVLDGAWRSAASLLATLPEGERLRNGALVVLAGRPNAGKSSLFNALLGTSRALVTEIPGTTRDTIEAHSEVLGWPVRLADTAGLRDADERLERMGIEVSRRYMAAADLLLLCVDAGQQLTPEEEILVAGAGTLLVRSKADLLPDQRPGAGEIRVSVVTGEGLDVLRENLAARLYTDRSSYADLAPMLSRERHRAALTRAVSGLEEARPHLAPPGDPVIAAHHVRESIDAIEELIGVVHPDDVLGRVFSSFCVGK
jgi:tRNA modification GTPase